MRSCHLSRMPSKGLNNCSGSLTPIHFPRPSEPPCRALWGIEKMSRGDGLPPCAAVSGNGCQGCWGQGKGKPPQLWEVLQLRGLLVLSALRPWVISRWRYIFVSPCNGRLPVNGIGALPFYVHNVVVIERDQVIPYVRQFVTNVLEIDVVLGVVP